MSLKYHHGMIIIIVEFVSSPYVRIREDAITQLPSITHPSNSPPNLNQTSPHIRKLHTIAKYNSGHFVPAACKLGVIE